jgi:hypothetical protein
MFGRLLPLRDNTTLSATISPTDSGKPIGGGSKFNVMDLVSNTSEPEATPIREASYAQLLVSSTDRYVSQGNSRIPLDNNAYSESATLTPTTNGTASLTLDSIEIVAFSPGDTVQIDLSGSNHTVLFTGVISSVVGSILTINRIANISPGFPATGVWYIYPTISPQTSTQIRLYGSLVPYSTIGNIVFTAPISVSSFTLQYPQYLLQGHFTRLAITQLQFEWNIPTINDRNDTFALIFKDLTDNSITNVGATIANGWYTPTDLATIIEATVLNNPTATTAGFNCYYSSGVFTFNVSNSDYVIKFSNAFYDTPAINNFYLTVGLNYTTSFAFDDTIVSGAPPMTYTRWVDITSTELTKYQKVKDSITLRNGSHLNTLTRVYCNPPSTTSNSSGEGGGVLTGLPFYITFDFPSPKYIRWNGKDSLLNFDLNVFDEFGEPLYWTPQYNSEFQFTLLASES